MGQFYSPYSGAAARRTFNAWLANVAADAGFPILENRSSAVDTLERFFVALDAARAKEKGAPSSLTAEKTSDSSSPPPSGSGMPPSSVNVSPSANPSAYAAASYSATPEGDRYSTALVPAQASVEQKKADDSARNIGLGLTAAALLLML